MSGVVGPAEWARDIVQAASDLGYGVERMEPREIILTDGPVTITVESHLLSGELLRRRLLRDGTGDGVTTDCPLVGVHEHSFRGPHRFTEWYEAEVKP